jgi:hypothetical protein
MRIIKIISAALLGFSLIAGLFIYKTYAYEISESNQVDTPYYYRIIKQDGNPVLYPGEPGILKLTIQNLGQEEWPVDNLFLGSVFFDGTPDRHSRFATSEWIHSNRVSPIRDNRDSIKPGQTVRFNVPVRAVQNTGIFQENFQPVLENISWIPGNANIEWLIQIGNDLSYQGAEDKQIRIMLDEQRLLAIDNKVVVMDIDISSGAPGYGTPRGRYRILNHAEVAYSAAYYLYMDYWMALSHEKYGFQGYGLHRLPYWKVKPGKYSEGQIIDGRLYTNGRLYEDYAHLGQKKSHGCVRVGINESKVLYNWAENRTVVDIV